MKIPPTLKPLHSEEMLINSKLEIFRRLTTDELIASLQPDRPGSLKTRLDGTMIDGHHRIHILRERGVKVDFLPRETIVKK